MAELPPFLLDELITLFAAPVLFTSFLELAERLDRSLAKFASLFNELMFLLLCVLGTFAVL